MTNAPGAGGVRLKTLRACSRPDLAESAPRRLAAATMFYLRRDNFGFAAPQGSSRSLKWTRYRQEIEVW
jgi:hypothetical protein